MERIATIMGVILLSCLPSHAQTSMSPPAIGATSPLGIPVYLDRLGEFLPRLAYYLPGRPRAA